MRALSLLFPVLLSLTLPGVAQAQSDSERAAARSAADAGRDAFQAGRYAEAADYFTRAEQLVHAPPHVLYLARSQVKLGRLVEARENFLKLTRETLPPKAPKAFVDAQAAAEQELDALEGRLPTVTIAVQGSAGSSVSVKMDGNDLPAAMVGIPFPVNPGQHVFIAYSEGAESSPVAVTLSEGGKETVMLTLRNTGKPAVSSSGGPAPAGATTGTPAEVDGGGASSGPSGLRIASYVSLGVGAVSAGVGAFFLVKGGSTREEADELYDECVERSMSERCEDEEAEADIEALDSDASLQQGIGIGGLVVGGLGLATGITLLILDSGGSSEAHGTAPRVTPFVGLGSLGVTGTF